MYKIDKTFNKYRAELATAARYARLTILFTNKEEQAIAVDRVISLLLKCGLTAGGEGDKELATTCFEYRGELNNAYFIKEERGAAVADLLYEIEQI